MKYMKNYNINKNITLMWIPSHMGMIGNEKADEEAKKAIEKWQQNNDVNINLLRRLKNDYSFVKFPNDMTRKDQNIITRLRTGYTRHTHSYKMDKKDPPKCEKCDKIITVKHLMISCKELETKRKKHNVKFEDLNNPDKLKNIIAYIKDIGLHDKI